jgi:SAM-dependent methyltransferase
MKEKNKSEVDWENRYQIRDTPWDKGEAAPPLVDFLKEHKIQGRILVPGCGLGYDAKVLASQGAQVVGIDIAKSAIQKSREINRDFSIEYKLADLFDLPASLRGSFDWIWEHTCFCAISPERRKDYVEAVSKALKPNGSFLGVFYLDPDSPEGGPPFGVTRQELNDFFSPYFDLEKEWVPTRAYPGREGRELMRLLHRRAVAE